MQIAATQIADCRLQLSRLQIAATQIADCRLEIGATQRRRLVAQLHSKTTSCSLSEWGKLWLLLPVRRRKQIRVGAVLANRINTSRQKIFWLFEEGGVTLKTGI